MATVGVKGLMRDKRDITLAVKQCTVPDDWVVVFNTLHWLTQVAVWQDEASITRRCHHGAIDYHLRTQRPVAWQRHLGTVLHCSQHNTRKPS